MHSIKSNDPKRLVRGKLVLCLNPKNCLVRCVTRSYNVFLVLTPLIILSFGQIDVVIPSGSSYTLPQPANQASKLRPFCLPLVLICRRFLCEMLRPLTDEARKTLGDYVTVCGLRPPTQYSKVYGPKMMWKPADVSFEEYNFWMTIAPIIASQDYKVCKFGDEWMNRWRALATARVFLWDDDNMKI